MFFVTDLTVGIVVPVSMYVAFQKFLRNDSCAAIYKRLNENVRFAQLCYRRHIKSRGWVFNEDSSTETLNTSVQCSNTYTIVTNKGTFHSVYNTNFNTFMSICWYGSCTQILLYFLYPELLSRK